MRDLLFGWFCRLRVRVCHCAVRNGGGFYLTPYCMNVSRDENSGHSLIRQLLIGELFKAADHAIVGSIVSTPARLAIILTRFVAWAFALRAWPVWIDSFGHLILHEQVLHTLYYERNDDCKQTAKDYDSRQDSKSSRGHCQKLESKQKGIIDHSCHKIALATAIIAQPAMTEVYP
jgi:hypothetical protein